MPNSKLSNEIIINLSRQVNRRIDIELKFSYAIDIEEIRQILSETILSSKNLLTEPTHGIAVSALEPDGYRLIINVWTKANGFTDVKYVLQEKIINALKQKGVKLPGM